MGLLKAIACILGAAIDFVRTVIILSVSALVIYGVSEAVIQASSLLDPSFDSQIHEGLKDWNPLSNVEQAPPSFQRSISSWDQLGQFVFRFFQSLLGAIWVLGILIAVLGGASLLNRVLPRGILVAILEGLVELVVWIYFIVFMHAVGSALWDVVAERALAVVESINSDVATIVAAAISLVALVNFPRVIRAVVERIRMYQEELHSLLVGETHSAFIRRPQAEAERRSADRRRNIEKFLVSGTVPALRTEYLFAVGDRRKTREHIIRNVVEEEGPPRLVNEFLEFPRGSPMVLKQPCLSEGPEEAVGQFVRLNFEAQPPAQRDFWTRLWAYERNEELIVPLLARVVDAAVLADHYANTLRRETDWNAMPFYERIYAEYNPLPFPLRCLLRPLIGNCMPARVVIETHYPEVFFKALFGDTKLKPSRYQGWFGIGIHIVEPNTPQGFLARLCRRWGYKTPPLRRQRILWKGAQLQPQCRRLKTHLLGVLSGRLNVRFTADAPIDQHALSRVDSYHIMPSGSLADGCPSVVRPDKYPEASPPPTTSDRPNRVEVPLPPRGTVSNAPPVWLFPVSTELFLDCRNNCLKSPARVPAQSMDITQSGVGKISLSSSLLPRRYWGPGRKWLYRRIWSGAFFDRDLAIVNRFPLFGVSFTGGEYNSFSRAQDRVDLRGAFTQTMFSDGYLGMWRAFAQTHRWHQFGGIFVSTQGPEHAGNLLLPEPLLYDYLNHVAQRDAVLKAMKECKGPPFVPKPHETESR